MAPEQAVALAESARGVYDSLTKLAAADTGVLRIADSVRASEYLKLNREILGRLQEVAGIGPGATISPPAAPTLGQQLKAFWDRIWGRGCGAGLWYLFGCLVTALMISFGAPFWNDVAGAVLRFQRNPSKQEPVPATASGGAG
jgi:hypothetical protein